MFYTRFCQAGRLGVKPEHHMVIEVAPHRAEGARRAGMKCIALTTTYDRPTLNQADLFVDTFKQIDLAAP